MRLRGSYLLYLLIHNIWFKWWHHSFPTLPGVASGRTGMYNGCTEPEPPPDLCCHTPSDMSGDEIMYNTRASRLLAGSWGEDEECWYEQELAQSTILRILARIFGYAPMFEPSDSDCSCAFCNTGQAVDVSSCGQSSLVYGECYGCHAQPGQAESAMDVCYRATSDVSS